MRKTKSGSKATTKAKVKQPKAKPKPASGRERMRAYRERMKEAGYRPVQRWVLDFRNPEIRERIRREAARLDEHPETKELNAWLDAVLADADWT